MRKLYKPLKGGNKGDTKLDPNSPIPSKSPGAQTEVREQDLFVPLSENLIIGFFFDMIHDFPESSVMTNDSKTDVEYLIMVFDSVFSGYWPECGYTLKEIIRYFNEQHGYTMTGGTRKRKPDGQIVPREAGLPSGTEEPPSDSRRPKRQTAINSAAKTAKLAQEEGKAPKKSYLSAAGIIEKAHGFFYDLITRQGENNGVLTFDYNPVTKTGKPVSPKQGSVITDVKKIAGGGGGLPSNYFFGGFIDHQVRVQTMLQANTTTANVFKTYSGARDGANIQSFTEAAIKAINLGSPPDYTDALGSWEQYTPATTTPQRGGEGQDSDSASETSSVANASNVTLASTGEEDPTGMNRLPDNDNSVSKPMFVVEDALKSATQLPATFALNNRFVFSVGEGNKFNLVPIKSTAERYDAAAKKLQTPPELYDKGTRARKELLERIATKQASCYDYFYRKFNLRFGSVVGPKGNGVPIATKDQSKEWRDFVTVSIGPNKLYFKDTANLVAKMAIGSNIIGAMSDNDVLDHSGRESWATAFVKYLVGGTEKASTLFTNKKVMEADITEKMPGTEKEIEDIQSKLSDALDTKKTQHIEDIDDKLPLDYLYNFSFYAAKEAKTTKFIPYDDDVLFPSYYEQMQRIHNIRKQRQTLAAQLKGITNEWLLSRLTVYQIRKETLMTKFQEVIKKQPFGNTSKVDPKALFYPTGMSTPSWSKFVTFLLLRQEKASKPIENKSVQNYVSLLWKDVIPDGDGNPKANQLSLSIKMILTVVFNLRLAELCMRKASQVPAIGKREAGKNDNGGLNKAIWVPTIDLYLTDIVMQGCSNDSKLVVSPSGTRDKNTVEVSVSGDSEQDVKSGASVAAVLNKWRTQIIDKVFSVNVQNDDTKGICLNQSGSKKETAAEKACIVSHSNDYKAQLKCLSGTAGMARAAPMHDCLANWLQTVVGNAALQIDANKPPGPGFTPPAGFTPQDLRKSFGELFQKTVGDFFQVKVAQFLNDTMECFTCEGGKCASDSSAGTFGRSTYRPYAENPKGPTQGNLLVAADAFYKTYKRPIVASTVQLNTFDVMAGLIGLQQSANVVLQTIAKTTRSPGTALYGVSNLSAPVRKFIETKLVETDAGTYKPEATPMEQDEEETPSQSAADTSVEAGEGDEEDGDAKEVDKSSIQTIDVDIDLVSVIRKMPTIVVDVEGMLSFLNQNELAGASLTGTLQKTYTQLATDSYAPESARQWVFTLRLIFDNLCYYRQMRPEEALARAKVITYALKRLKEHPPATAKTNEILKVFVGTVDLFKKENTDRGLEMGASVVPIFPKEFAKALQTMNDESKSGGDDMTRLAFSEIIDLMQKTSGDKKISKAVDNADGEVDNYEKYTSGWMEMFEKVNMQNREMEAAEALLSLSAKEGPKTRLYEAEESREMEQDVERTSMESDEYDSDDEETDPEAAAAVSTLLEMGGPRKRQRTGGRSRRHRKRLPKHRTIRKRSSSEKTLTQVLKELTLGI